MSSWTPSSETDAVVLVTASQSLRDEVARAALAAGTTLLNAATVSEAVAQRPAVVLLDPDHASHPVAGTAVIVVGLDGAEGHAWAGASRCGADRVAILPQAARWLAEHLGRLRQAQNQGRVIGVLGAVGGAGATTAAGCLAAGAADTTRTLLMDGDPLGGGIELALGAETLPGVRWPDLQEVLGTLNPDQFAQALPRLGGFSMLSMGTTQSDPGLLGAPGVSSVMSAARTAFDLTVVDAARGWSVDGTLLPYCDSVLLVVPGRVRAIPAARSIVSQLQPLPVQAVVRGPLGADLDPHRLADSVGVPCAGYLPHLRAARSAEDQGRLLELVRQRSVRTFYRSVLENLLPQHDPAVVA